MTARLIARIAFPVLMIALRQVTLSAQGKASEPFTTGADFCSSYIWRGSQLGSGPHIQPSIVYNKGSFSFGAWGSFDFSGYQETDLYLSFSLPEGFSAGITDYYLPGLRYFDYSKGSGSHAFELNFGFSADKLNISANYILNEAGGAGSAGNDLYFEAGYAFESFSIFAGMGNGWHTYDPETGRSNFNLCNTGIGVSRMIRVTESFEIPVSGRLVFNPDKERLFLVISLTL
ncbi:MAG TPA: hypothetical protein PLX08_09930 [Bacteroidales bacterium]|jgi:hypothetical protein|nr:hypothetical protein [Bacteroidales bacterium]